MNDKQFQQLINLTIKKRKSYATTLKKLEEEYRIRFGSYPSDVDDDFFIDSFHGDTGETITVEELTNAATQ